MFLIVLKALYWQRNQQSGQNFDLQTDIPYLFGSNVGANLNMNIYRQDSTFANVKFRPSLYYHLSAKQKIGARGNFEISSVLDDTYTSDKILAKKELVFFMNLQKLQKSRCSFIKPNLLQNWIC
jgi:hypothetical protein